MTYRNFGWGRQDPTWKERISDNETIGDYIADAKDLLTLKSGRFLSKNWGKMLIGAGASTLTAAKRGISEYGLDRILNETALPPVRDATNVALYSERGQYLGDNVIINTIGVTGAELLDKPLAYVGIAAGVAVACAAYKILTNVKVRNRN